MIILIFFFVCTSLISDALLRPFRASQSFTTKRYNVDVDKAVIEPQTNDIGSESNSVINPSVTWTAYVKSAVKVKESKRTIEQYMALPASEYSILSANQIERIDDSNFKCTLGTMNFFGTKITPTLYVDVTVYPEEAKSVIAVTRAETTGSTSIIKKITMFFFKLFTH